MKNLLNIKKNEKTAFTRADRLGIRLPEEEQKPHSYWDDLLLEKDEEILTLTQSVPCTGLEAFEIVQRETDTTSSPRPSAWNITAW